MRNPKGTTEPDLRYPSGMTQHVDGKYLVEAVREAARHHNSTWEALVPDHFTIDIDHEDAEEEAYAEMARAKTALRDHICETYGISLRELISLAKP
jgi:hypothetical protein